ncbi:MAG: DJ-1/PfpI family protein [Acidimicrobiia bacterium]
MQIALLLYDDLTLLDAIGPSEVLGRIPDAELTLVSPTGEPVTTDQGLTLLPSGRIAEVSAPDVVVVPGGHGEERLRDDARVLDWLRAVDATSQWTTSVCTGSLLLGAAGFLEGRRATSHWTALEVLRQFGAEPTLERVAVDGKYVTAAGVSSGIDMALWLAAQLASDIVAQTIQLGIEYDPQPPFDAGAPHKAPPEAVEYFRSSSRFANVE